MWGLHGEEAQKRTEPPVIYHYTDAEVLKEELTGEYTQWGICFKTRSFSPFVISTAAQSSSGGGYYYGGASTPSISAVKTADAAKSATDYTSGIYGLTFRSTAAFSGFKGVQVDGRTIAAANYVAEDNGGIEVYLKAVYLRTLKDGRHTVTILSDAGNVTMNFTIGGVDSPTTFDAGIGAYVRHGAGVRGRHGLDAEKEALTGHTAAHSQYPGFAGPIVRHTTSTPGFAGGTF